VVDSLACLALATDLSELADCAATLQLTATLAAAAILADHMAQCVPIGQVSPLAAESANAAPIV
jgi:hypothetical protein